MKIFFYALREYDEQKYVEAWNDTPISDGIDENLAVDNCKDQFHPMVLFCILVDQG